MNEVIVVSPQSVSVGDYFDVDIVVKPSGRVAGVQANLCYDAEVVEAVLVTSGDFMGSNMFFKPGVIDNTNGVVKDYAGVTIGKGSSVNEEGTFITIRFVAKGTGGVGFILDKVILGSPTAKSLPVDIVNGELEISVPKIDGIFTQEEHHSLAAILSDYGFGFNYSFGLFNGKEIIFNTLYLNVDALRTKILAEVEKWQ